MLQTLLALRPLLFHACDVSDIEAIRRDRALRAASGPEVVTVPGAEAMADGLAQHPSGLVLFWPGGTQGPITAGRDRMERHRQPGSLRIVRAGFMEVLQRNPARDCHVTFARTAPQLDRPGHVGARDGRCFHPIHAGPWNAAEVLEVAFTGFVDLPSGTVWAESFAGPWQPL